MPQRRSRSPGLAMVCSVQTRYRFEKRVAEQLSHKRCEVYLPVRTEHHLWSDRRQIVTIPLFPGYAFVHIDQTLNARSAVLQTAGLIGFVSFRRNGCRQCRRRRLKHLQMLLQREGAVFPASVRARRAACAGSGVVACNGLEGAAAT